jgi:hypothetical protein
MLSNARRTTTIQRKPGKPSNSMSLVWTSFEVRPAFTLLSQKSFV